MLEVNQRNLIQDRCSEGSGVVAGGTMQSIIFLE